MGNQLVGIGVNRHMGIARSTRMTRADVDVSISGNHAMLIDHQQWIDLKLLDLGQFTANLRYPQQHIQQLVPYRPWASVRNCLR